MATEAQIKGEQAAQILNSPVFNEAFDSILNATVDSIADAPVVDAETRNQLGLLLASASAFKTQLFEYINDAKMEADAEKRRQREEARKKT